MHFLPPNAVAACFVRMLGTCAHARLLNVQQHGRVHDQGARCQLLEQSTLQPACLLAIVCRTVHDGAPGPVRQALRHVHASACKVPHALGQLPRQLRAAAGVLCNPASHAAGPIALRLDLTVLAQAAACVSFGKGTLRRVYAEPAGAEGDEAAGSRR